MSQFALPWPRRRDDILRAVLLALLYFFLGRLSFALAVSHGTVTNMVFAAEGISLAFVILYGAAMWPGVFIGQAALALSGGLDSGSALAIAAINSIEALLGGWLFHRLGLRSELRRLHDFGGLMGLSALILQPFSASLGTLVLYWRGYFPIPDWPLAWLSWWTGNMLGQVLFTSLLLAWLGDPNWRDVTASIRRGTPAWGRRLGVIGVATIAGVWWIGMPHPFMAFALSFPLMVWIAIHWGPRGATLAAVLLTVLSSWFTAKGLAPFSQSAMQERIFFLDVFVFSIAVTAMVAAGLVSQERQATRTLKENEERMALAFTAAQEGVWDWDMRTGVVYYSPRWKGMLGYVEDEIKPTVDEWRRLLHPEDQAGALRAVDSVLNGADLFEVEFRLRHKQGHYVHVLSRGYPIRERAGGTVLRFVGTHFDLTERKRHETALQAAHDKLETRVEERTHELTLANAALQNEIRQRKLVEATLHAEKERAQITLASIGDGVITTDLAGVVESINPMASTLVGVSEQNAISQPFHSVFRAFDDSTGKAIANPAIAALESGQIKGFDTTVVLERPDGSRIYVSDSAAPIRDPAGRIVGAVVVFRDVTEQHRLSQAVSYQASHDALTGALNRAEFERRLQLLIDHSAQDGRHHALCYLDLDAFKVVNDTCGHGAGDELLRQLTGLLRARLRDRDSLARLGGDEFGILLGDCDMHEAALIADQLRVRVQQFRFAWQDKSFTLGVSIGVVPITAQGADVASLLSQADGACYVAKEHGRNRVHVHQTGDAEVERRRADMRWVTRLELARDEQRLRLYYQPIIELNGSDPMPAYGEVLLRSIDESGNVLEPNSFIPAAERFHQMIAIDRWVVARLFDTIKRNGSEGGSGRYSVNLSGQSLGNADFLRFVTEQFEMNHIPGERICFEITETAAIGKLEAANAFIGTLKTRGCKFALDDFGSGLSSFGYLKTLPVDYLKIDGRFVRHMVSDPVDRAMVEAIQRIGSVMGLQTIGEWVEDNATLESLRNVGVDFAQGIALGEPQPLLLQ